RVRVCGTTDAGRQNRRFVDIAREIWRHGYEREDSMIEFMDHTRGLVAELGVAKLLGVGLETPRNAGNDCIFEENRINVKLGERLCVPVGVPEPIDGVGWGGAVRQDQEFDLLAVVTDLGDSNIRLDGANFSGWLDLNAVADGIFWIPKATAVAAEPPYSVR